MQDRLARGFQVQAFDHDRRFVRDHADRVGGRLRMTVGEEQADLLPQTPEPIFDALGGLG